MSTKVKSIIKYQWVRLLPTLITATTVLGALGYLKFWELYLPMSLGIIVGNVVDIDNRFSGKVWNSLIVFIWFTIAEFLVMITYDYFWLMAIGSVLACFAFVMLGDFTKSFQTIGFGAVLVTCYSIFLSAWTTSFDQRFSALLFMLLSAMYYTIISLIVHLIFPNRGIKQNISDLYEAMAEFISIKSNFFDPDDDSFEQKLKQLDREEETGYDDRNSSRIYNPQFVKARNALIQQFETSKASLLIRLKAFSKRKVTSDMFRFYLTADAIFKTFDFNLQDYAQLKDRLQDSDIMFRIQRILMLYANSLNQFSYDLKSNRGPVLDPRLLVSIQRLENSIHAQHELHYYHVDSLMVILNKLKRVYWLLQNINNEVEDKKAIENFNFENSNLKTSFKIRLQRVIGGISHKSATFRHALRISIFMAISMVFIYYGNLQLSFWFMMAGVLVIQPNYSMTKHRVKYRVIGSIAGSLIGGLLAFDIASHAGWLVLFTVVSFTAFQFTRMLNYGYSTMFLTISVFCTFRIAGMDVDVLIILERIIANTFGALTTWFLISRILPEWNYLDLGRNVRQVYETNRYLLLSMLGALEQHPISSFDLNKRSILAQNAHRSFQSVVSSIVTEPKIYHLYISPSIRLMALNDYVLSNLNLINGLIVEKMEQNDLASINPSTLVMLEKLGIMFTRLYSYNALELKEKVTDLKQLFDKCEEEDKHKEQDSSAFNLNFYIRDRILGIAYNLLNYRRELAKIYQISHLDQNIVAQTHAEIKAKEILSAQQKAEAKSTSVAKAEAESPVQMMTAEMSSNSNLQAFDESGKQTESEVRKDSKRMLHNSLEGFIFDQISVSEQDKLQHDLAVNYLQDQAVNSINDIKAGINKFEDGAIPANVTAESNSVASQNAEQTRNSKPETDQQDSPAPEVNRQPAPDSLATDLAQLAETIAVEQQQPQESDDYLLGYLASQEARLGKKIEQEVIWHDLDPATESEPQEATDKSA